MSPLTLGIHLCAVIILAWASEAATRRAEKFVILPIIYTYTPYRYLICVKAFIRFFMQPMNTIG